MKEVQCRGQHFEEVKATVLVGATQHFTRAPTVQKWETERYEKMMTSFDATLNAIRYSASAVVRHPAERLTALGPSVMSPLFPRALPGVSSVRYGYCNKSSTELAHQRSTHKFRWKLILRPFG